MEPFVGEAGLGQEGRTLERRLELYVVVSVTGEEERTIPFSPHRSRDYDNSRKV